ncbi:IS4 family transposase [Methyloglobulus sp.]|uniref:IS4 family transposase n=1 Tax=Methyloglobulus sp. TaxID=2518622 RepID=UPI003989AEDB
MIPIDELGWSQQLFGGSELGDARRTARLVEVAARMAKQVGSSLAKSCDGDQAALLGSHRLMRNGAVKPVAIRASGFARVAGLAQTPELPLAVEDTTSVSYPRTVAAGLGLTGGKQAAKRNGFLVHSVLLLDAQSGRTVGLIAQRHWCRGPASYGKNHTRKQRAYQDRESYKWERASTDTAQCLGSTMQRTISVCDRESDIYGYLWHKHRNSQRFVVRAQANRRLKGSEAKPFGTLQRGATALCGYTVATPQRGGRKARAANVLLRSATLDFLAPEGSSVAEESLRINVILAEEVDAPPLSGPLHWVLLTTEAIGDAQAALQVVRYYELRRRIEGYHKVWKSGIGVERQRFQSIGNLERMLVITAFLAVRLLQLRELLDATETTSEKVLTEDEWKVLWVSTERNKPLPKTAPPAHWAFYAIAKLGGFTDTKRTGRVGWDTIWQGWFRLQERLQGYQLSKSGLAEL